VALKRFSDEGREQTSVRFRTVIEISDKELLNLVLAADEELFQEGAEPKERCLPVISKVMTKLQYSAFILAGEHTPAIVKRITALHSSLYRPADIAVGGIHGGIFMFRDVFARVDIPIIYGSARIDPLKLTNFSENQIRWLLSRQADFQMFNDQFTDIMDFAGGLGNLANYRSPPKAALEVFWLAAFQLQAAAAALSVAYDFRGAVQSAIIGTELALKGGLAVLGLNEGDRRKYSHDLSAAANALFAAWPDFDIERILCTISRFPPFVANRYSAIQPNRVDVGHIVMGAQFIAGEVMRQTTGYSIRQAQPTKRVYPHI